MTYWKLRALAMEIDRDEARIKLQFAAKVEAFHAALREAGIDPAMPMRWDDATASITRVPVAVEAPLAPPAAVGSIGV